MSGIAYSRDDEKISKIKDAMEREGIDVLVLRLPENVVYLSGYWPFFGVSYIVFPLDSEPCIIPHQGEEEYALKSWIKDVRPYGWETPEVMGDYLHAGMNVLIGVLRERGLDKRHIRVGVEASVEFVACPYNRRESWCVGTPTIEMLRQKLNNAEIVDFAQTLYSLKSVKTEKEVSILRIVNELTDIGLESFHDAVREGRTEAEVAGEVEYMVTAKGTGFKNIEKCIVTAFVMSGPRTAEAYKMFNNHTNKRIQRGEPVLLELNVCADGYWSDTTRVYFAGKPEGELRKLLEVVLTAQEAAISHVKDGVRASDVCNVAFKEIRGRGYGGYIRHRLGHGIGTHLHEPIPALHIASSHILRKNMIHSVEPGVYVPGSYGIRIEDIVLVGGRGAELLTKYPRLPHEY
ncbi:Xaa-Pro dipeptidase [Candidatus Calditenuaceae archaeon HR02]|nr:Xaa-Pro dipeptidase [Candidatus Calditenuaceae archaeon HR02]